MAMHCYLPVDCDTQADEQSWNKINNLLEDEETKL